MSIYRKLALQSAEETTPIDGEELVVEEVPLEEGQIKEAEGEIAETLDDQLAIEEALDDAPKVQITLEKTVDAIENQIEGDDAPEGVTAEIAIALQDCSQRLLARYAVSLQKPVSLQSYGGHGRVRLNSTRLTMQALVQGIRDLIKKVVAMIKTWISRCREIFDKLVAKIDITGRKLASLKEKAEKLEDVPVGDEVDGGKFTVLLHKGTTFDPKATLGMAKSAADAIKASNEIATADIKKSIEEVKNISSVGDLAKKFASAGVMPLFKASVNAASLGLPAASAGLKWTGYNDLPNRMLLAACIPTGDVSDVAVIDGIDFKLINQFGDQIAKKKVKALSKSELLAGIDEAIAANEALKASKAAQSKSWRGNEEIAAVIESLANSNTEDKVVRAQIAKAQTFAKALTKVTYSPARTLASVASDIISSWYAYGTVSHNAIAQAAKASKKTASKAA